MAAELLTASARPMYLSSTISKPTETEDRGGGGRARRSSRAAATEKEGREREDATAQGERQGCETEARGTGCGERLLCLLMVVEVGVSGEHAQGACDGERLRWFMQGVRPRRPDGPSSESPQGVR